MGCLGYLACKDNSLPFVSLPFSFPHSSVHSSSHPSARPSIHMDECSILQSLIYGGSTYRPACCWIPFRLSSYTSDKAGFPQAPKFLGEGPQPLSGCRTARKPWRRSKKFFLNEIERRRDAAGSRSQLRGRRLCPGRGEALTSHSSYLILSVSFQSIFMDWREREDLVLPAFP